MPLRFAAPCAVQGNGRIFSETPQSRRSIYFKNFAATAAMVLFSFLILGTAFVFLGRSYVISEYRGNMVSNAEEVSHAAQALVRSGELTSWDQVLT